MAYTFQELKKKTVDQLREIASTNNVQGYTQLNKEHLLKALCQTLHIDMFEHHKVVGVDKAGIKLHIKQLKDKRQEAIEGKDHKKLKIIRRKIHRLKRKIHKATV